MDMAGPHVGLESSLVDRQSQPVAADELVVGVPRLGVLTDHVHILEGALQGCPS